MKKITLLLLIATLIVSCGKNKGEQMLYDYQQNNVKALNFDLADLDYEVQKIEKITDITSSDSLKIIEEMLSPAWEQLEHSLSDTEKFEKLRYAYIGIGADKETISELERIGHYYTKISKYPDSLLTTKYRAIYSIKNPMLNNTKQTFDKFYYTNPTQTKFIKEEEIEKE